MELVGICVIVAVALSFDVTNGFHDAANAVATSISTRALTPRVALAMSAVLNLLGALVSRGVAHTISAGILDAQSVKGSHGLVIVFAALVGAIAWNLITWYYGLPSSSSHALIGGLVGAGLAGGSSVLWHGVWSKVVIPMVLSPVIGFAIGYVVMLAVLWVFRGANPRRVNRGFRRLQTASAAAMSWAHGTQDAQKTMGVITLALYTAGYIRTLAIPLWVVFAAATAMAVGTYSGGRRIISTLGRRVIHLDPPRGFAAEASASTVLMLTAYLYKAPVSTTHVISSSIMGVGATRRLSAVRWGVARSIMAAWILTLPAAGLVAALVWWVAHFVG